MEAKDVAAVGQKSGRHPFREPSNTGGFGSRRIRGSKMALSFQVLVLVALLAGFVGAMSGLGGGVVLVPALTLLGVDIKHAIAVSMLCIIATSCSSASTYVRAHLASVKIATLLEIFTMLGALVGASITLAISPKPLYVVFGLVLLSSGFVLGLARRQGQREISPDRFSRWLELNGSYPDANLNQTVDYQGRRAHLGVAAMFGAGVIAGLLGIGAGALNVLTEDLIMGLPPKVCTTTSNLIIGVTALAGTSVYLSAGLINASLAAPVILGVVLGAFLGARLLVRLTNQAVRRVFLFVLFLLAAEMIFRGIAGGL